MKTIRTIIHSNLKTLMLKMAIFFLLKKYSIFYFQGALKL